MKVIKLAFLFFFLFSCKDDKHIKNETHYDDKSSLENVLKKQLTDGANKYIEEAGIEIPKDEFSIVELEAITEIAKKTLIGSGYKYITQEDFGKIVSKVFGRIIDFSSEKNYLYINNFNKCDKELNLHPFNGVDYNGCYIVKKEKFITNFYFIPELIDYQKEYPEISKIENNIPTKYKDKEDNNYTVELWKEIDNLEQKRQKNIQTLINRNKFLFNESKASFAWLKFNDEYFLDDLVKTFGYVEDKDLSKFVLDRSLEDNEEFGKVLWNKDCNGKLQFHKEILDIVASLNKEEQAKYFDKIVDYLEYLLIEKPAQEIHLDLTFSQKAEMLGKLAYYTTKATNTDVKYYYRFFEYLNKEEYQKEFEIQDYYKIKDFKEMYDETKNGGVWLPGMPE